MPTLSDRLKWMLAEIHDLDCAPSNDAFWARSAALKQQINDLVSVMAEKGLIECGKSTARL